MIFFCVRTHMPNLEAPVTEVSPSRNAALLIALLLTTLAFSGGLIELVGRWHRQEEYSHGFFLPLISLWLLWQRRAALKQSMGAPSAWGLVCLVTSALMLVVGEFSAIFILIQTGYLLALCGIVLAYGGTSLLRLTLLPIGLLLFAIPLPYFVDSQLSWRLQLVSSNLGVGLLRLLDYPVYLEGNVIDLGMYKLQVVEACSGLRYLYPLLSIGFLMAYMYPAAMRYRLALFLSTIPITVLTNSMRIAMVGVLVSAWGNGMADGFLHYFEGWVIFLICQLIMMAEIWLIERFTLKRSLIDVQQFPIPDALPPTGLPLVGNPLRWLLVGMALMAAAGATSWFVAQRVEARPERTSLKTFPLKIGTWQAKESSLPIEVEQALGFDDYVLADYAQEGSSKSVNFYVAYYASQRKGVSPHSPQVCIPGGGWVISALGNAPVKLGAAGSVDVVRIIISKDGQRQLVYYWFEQRGRQLSNEYLMKWQLLVDAITRNRTDGALVRVVTPVQPNEDIAVADERLRQFLQGAEPLLPAYVPH